jgi:hypothetical protein
MMGMRWKAIRPRTEVIDLGTRRRHSQPVPRHLTVVEDVETRKACCSLKRTFLSSYVELVPDEQLRFLDFAEMESSTHTNTDLVRRGEDGSRHPFPKQSSKGFRRSEIWPNGATLRIVSCEKRVD